MEADIIAAYYGMSVCRSRKILRYVRLTALRRHLAIAYTVSSNVDNASGL